MVQTLFLSVYFCGSEAENAADSWHDVSVMDGLMERIVVKVMLRPHHYMGLSLKMYSVVIEHASTAVA